MEDLSASVEFIQDQVALIQAKGYIDTVTVSVIEKKIQETLEKKIYKLIVDLQQINYVSSAGWGVFVSELKDIRDNNGDLLLIGMSPEVYDVYELMEFSSILKSFDNLEAALNHYGISPQKNVFVDPSKGTQKGEFFKAGGQSNPVLHGENSLNLEDKIKDIVKKDPNLDSKGIRELLKSSAYGNEKVGFFKMSKLLSQLNLSSPEERKLFARN